MLNATHTASEVRTASVCTSCISATMVVAQKQQRTKDSFESNQGRVNVHMLPNVNKVYPVPVN